MWFLVYATVPFVSDVILGFIFAKRDLHPALSRYIIAFSSGLVIAAAIFELLPEANVERNALFIGLGFFVFYLVEKSTMLHACGEQECEVHSLGTLTAIGMASDNIVDGLGIAVGYLLDPVLGLIIASAVLAHEIPQALSSTAILKRANRSWKEIFGMLGFAGAMYPIGAALSYVVPKELYQPIIAVVAGVFMYVGAGDLLMESHRRFNWKVILAVLLGGLVMFTLGKFGLGA